MSESIAIPLPVASAALARPTAVALIAERTWSWAELAMAVATRAAALHQQGVRAGDIVALIAPRDGRWLVDAHAIGWLGAAVAPISQALPTTALREAATLVSPSFHIARQLPDGGVDLPGRSLREGGAMKPALERPWPLHETRCLLLTSGTTGGAKVVRLSTAQVLLSACASAIRLGHLPEDRWLHCLPLSHVGGLAIVFRCAVHATTLELAGCFSAREVARRLRSGEVSGVSLTPRMLSDVLDAGLPAPLPPRLRVILVGGAAMDEPLLERARGLDLPVARTWGMTEAGSQVCTAEPGDLRSPGLPPLPFIRVAERDGQLCIHGPLVGRAPIHRLTGSGDPANGILASADRGVVDEQGRIHVLGRRDDVIVSGGAKTSPQQVEAALLAHPGIDEAAVVGRPDPRWGALPIAFIVGQMPHPDDTSLRAWCLSRLPGYSVPRDFVWRSGLPRGPLGKLRRRLLRQQAEAVHGAQKLVGHGSGIEAGQGHEGVAQGHRTAQVAGRFASDLVDEGDRSSANLADPGLDEQGFSQAHGFAVAGLRMNQGHAEAQLVEDHIEVAQRGADELLEAVVGVLEGAAEEDDAGPVDMVEAGGQSVRKAHGEDLLEVVR